MTGQKSTILTAATVFICLIYMSGCQKLVSSSNNEYYTTPDLWEQPRLYHASVENSRYPWDQKIIIEKYDKIDIGDSEKVYSPNAAYWLQKRFSERGTFQAVIYNEHRFIVIDTSTDDHYSKNVEWINEKLVYIRDWMGRILGFDMIYDVEKEEVLYFEVVNDGSIPFVQWTNDRIKRKNQNLKD